TLNVPDSQVIDNIKVNVDISHTFISDLLIIITHPDGVTEAALWVGDCGNEDDLDVTFDDEGSAIACGNPTVGTFLPNEALSIFSGLDAQGDWELYVQDFFAQDPGVLNDWSIEICVEEQLSVEEFDQDNFAIFPNPNKGEFTIQLNSNSGKDISVDVFDIRGRKIFDQSFNNNGDFNETVSLRNVQSGMYLVTVNDGNKQITKRIIVE
ncbi:MAG: T9SS type A sorting domain-containing protein, partial [Psychroserpens sp.]|nr:T9SS type A sorting domain-containing protein [Psychroserpens sp.]